MKLYEITQAIAEFEFEIDEETGEILNADDLDKLEMDLEQKFENISYLIKDLRSNVVAYKAEEDALAKRRKRDANKADSLERYLERHVPEKGYKSARCELKWTESSFVDIPDERMIPKKYMVKKLTYAPDKKAIKDAINSGHKVRGASIGKRRKLKVG